MHPTPDGTTVVDTIDPTDDGYPELPEAAFFWAGRLGNWFVLSDGDRLVDASVDDIVPPREESTQAFHVTSSGYERGVDLLAQLQHPSGMPVDLSAYRGFAFYARREGDNEQLVVALGQSGARTYFGALDDGAPFPSRTLTVTSEWQRFELSFDDFGLDDLHVATIDFVAGTEGGAVDFWLDDLSFRCRGACP